MTTVAIHQPEFFPYLGFFEKALASDIFIFLDDVDYKKNNFQNRNKFICDGMIKWLGVQVKRGNSKKLRDYYISDDQVFLNKINVWYAKPVSDILDKLSKNWRTTRNLAEFNTNLTCALLSTFGYSGEIILASDFNIRTTKTQRLVDLMDAVGGTKYLSGMGAYAYLDEVLFHQAKIEILYKQFDSAKAQKYFNCNSGYLSTLHYCLKYDAHFVGDYFHEK